MLLKSWGTDIVLLAFICLIKMTLGFFGNAVFALGKEVGEGGKEGEEFEVVYIFCFLVS